MVGIDVDGMTGRDVPEGDQALASYGLEFQGALDGDGLQEPVLGGERGKKGQAREEAEGSAADRIDGAHAGGIAENRLKDEPEGEALFREACGLERTSRRDEVTGAQLHKGGKEEKATRTGGGEPAFAQGGDVMRAVVPGDDAGRGRAGAVEDVDLFFGQKPSRAGGRCQPFFLDRPSSARTCPTSRALTVAPIWVTVSAISYLLPWVSKRVRMMRASTSLVRFDEVWGPVRLGKRSAAIPWRTALRLSE